MSAPKLSRVDDSSCHFFLGGGRIFTVFYATVHQKALYRRHHGLGQGIVWEKYKFYKNYRTYLAKDFQDKSRELHILFLALLCFELLG